MNDIIKKAKSLLAKISGRWPVKVLSVVVAIILFLFHRLGDLQERFFSAPLQIETSANLVPSSPYPHNIRITLRGDANSIYPIAEKDVEAYLDLSPFKDPGMYKVPVQVRKSGTAMEVETLEILVEPVEISIELDIKASKSVALSPNLQGSPENGFELIDWSLDPNHMVVDGPQNLIASITELSAGPVDLRSRSEDFSFRLKVESPNSLVAIRGDGMTEFRGFVRELILIRNFDELPIALTGLSEDLRARFEVSAGEQPPAASLRIEGPQRQLENFQPPENFLRVELAGIENPGIYTLPVKVELPEDFILSRYEPAEVRVRLTSRGEDE